MNTMTRQGRTVGTKALTGRRLARRAFRVVLFPFRLVGSLAVVVLWFTTVAFVGAAAWLIAALGLAWTLARPGFTFAGVAVVVGSVHAFSRLRGRRGRRKPRLPPTTDPGLLIGPFPRPAAAGPAGDHPKGRHRPEPWDRVSSRAEPIVAWRQWQLVPDADGPMLASLTGRGLWWTADLMAECRVHRSSVQSQRAWFPAAAGHRVPDLDCTCGIYALKDLSLWRRLLGPGLIAHGPVALSGRVIEGERGFRAERARIIGPLRIGVYCRSGGGNYRTLDPPSILCDAGSFDGPEPEWILQRGPRYHPICDQHLAEHPHWTQPGPSRSLLFTSDFICEAADALRRRYRVDVSV